MQLLYYIFTWCLLIGLVHMESDDEKREFLGTYSYLLRDTRFPVAIDTTSEDTHTRFDLSKLILTMTLSQKTETRKTEKLVEVRLMQPIQNNRVSGGVFQDDEYELERIIYFWNHSIDGTAATLIDQKGYPLEILMVFRNILYESFDNALEKPNGLGILSFLMDKCPGEVKNDAFQSYEKVLKKVQAESVATSSLGTLTKWFAGKLSANSTYYGYPGSYYDEKEKKRYHCATIATLSNVPQQCLTKEQFEGTFKSFTDANENPQTNTESAFEQTVPVVKAKGLESRNEL